MTPKICEHCGKADFHQAYRVQKEKGKNWIFVCGKCCLSLKKGEFYLYGGTWKSKEKRQGKFHKCEKKVYFIPYLQAGE